MGLCGGLLALMPAPGAAAEGKPAELKRVGDEIAAGKNATGEECRLRLVFSSKETPPAQRLSLYCEGWNAPSGEISRFRASSELPPERLLADSPWQKQFSQRLTGCGSTERTTLLGGVPAALQQCQRSEGGWPVVVVAASVGPRVYTFETFPTNLRVLERAAEILEGRRQAEQAQGSASMFSDAIRRAETIVGVSGKLIGIQDMGAADTLWELGKRYFRAGNRSSAEAAFRRVLEIHERLLGPGSPSLGLVLMELAVTASVQGRFAEADQIFARAAPLVEKSLAPDDQGQLVAYRSWHEQHQGRFPEAVALAQTSIALRERAGREESGGVAHSQATLAHALAGLKRYDDAADAAERALRYFDAPGHSWEWRMWWAGEMRDLLGQMLRDQKRFAEARAQFEKGLRRRELMFGESPRVARSHLSLGRLARAEGDMPAALLSFRRAAEIQIKNRAAREAATVSLVTPYLDALLDAAQAAPGQRQALHAEAFAAAQIPRGSETTRALQAMATRVAAGDPALAGVVRGLQDAGRRRDALRSALAQETLKLAEQRDAAREEQLRARYREAEEQAEVFETRLQAQFPRYARLTAEPPATVAEIAPLLRPGEAVAAFLVSSAETLVFLVRDGETHAHRAKITRRTLEREVKGLRASLDLSGGVERPFDVAAAHRLYTLLLGPLADRLAGVTHLIAVPSGPLLSLPLGVLVTRPPTSPAATDYRSTTWLVSDRAISVLPSVASLRDLRAVASPSVAPRPFIGFGDPALGGAAGETGAVSSLAALCRQGEPVDAAVLRALPRLPETARELRRIAQVLGADAGSVVLGADATEARVRAADLSRYRVVAFATHGLLPGELQCQSEPALVLTPPAVASATEDGLLDASEVAQLKLDADWVVLSACNTAGPDGRLGGESLSGLTRAFFYAGARAVLATHWAVASHATVWLTTGMLGLYAREPALGRAEALRRSQMALAGDLPTAHPFFWAPFILVGDGGGGS
ncbi:MAG: CHAT domain-containing tetratricopeptide repeat protein [Candidatus Rokubacteria bacterium]|nr:CHAT domain-containing tetratricopeptide repeat protein [Candidatus Rokubacteria bacterium]